MPTYQPMDNRHFPSYYPSEFIRVSIVFIPTLGGCKVWALDCGPGLVPWRNGKTFARCGGVRVAIRHVSSLWMIREEVSSTHASIPTLPNHLELAWMQEAPTSASNSTLLLCRYWCLVLIPMFLLLLWFYHFCFRWRFLQFFFQSQILFRRIRSYCFMSLGCCGSGWIICLTWIVWLCALLTV